MASTSNPLRIPAPAQRGSIQKTFVRARVLSGFTDPNHFRMISGEYLSSLSNTEQEKILAAAEDSRKVVAQLPKFEPKPVIIEDILEKHTDSIKSDPIFIQTFGQRPYRFCYIDPSQLIALQAWVEPRGDRVPKAKNKLLEFALPRKWDIPAELSFIPPIGPIQILSSSPSFQGVTVELDQVAGKVMLGPPKHLNLIQVAHFQGKYYLKNGYHRVSDAIEGGAKKLPALVIEAFTPDDVALVGDTVFNFGYVQSLERPPLVTDFATPAAIETKVRERRYGVIVNLDIKPLNIGI